LKKPKEVIKDRQLQKNRQRKGQKFEETERGNQRPSITEGQTTKGKKAWKYQKGQSKTANHKRTDNTGAKSLKKPKGVIRDRQSQKDRQYSGQKFLQTNRDNQRPSITEGQKTQGPNVWRN